MVELASPHDTVSAASQESCQGILLRNLMRKTCSDLPEAGAAGDGRQALEAEQWCLGAPQMLLGTSYF